MTLSDTRKYLWLARCTVNLARKLTWKTFAQIKTYHRVVNDQQVFGNDFRFVAVPCPAPQGVPASRRYSCPHMVGSARGNWCRRALAKAQCVPGLVGGLGPAWGGLRGGLLPGEWLETFMDLWL